MPSGSMLHILPTKHHLLAAKQEPHKRDYLLLVFMKNIEEFSGKSQGNEPSAEKGQHRAKGPGRRTREEIVKWNRNDSLEIPDKGETSDISGLPPEWTNEKKK